MLHLRQPAVVLSVVALTLSFVALSACYIQQPAPVAPAEAQDVPAPDLLEVEKRVIEVFRAAAPSVVFVANNAVVRTSWSSRRVQEVPRGSGSGIVWDRKGHIVTNFHVVMGASTITVTLQGGKKYPAKLAGAFVDRELAVLKIDAPEDELHPMRLGRSSTLLRGMLAIAIGNPFGLDHTLTVGHISALNRTIQALTERSIPDVIQTDAAINPGNSGGPLLNSRGELIGMTTAILSPSGANAGIGFAIPVDIVRRYVDQIIEHGRIRGAGLGVGLVPDETARQIGVRKGVMIEVADPRGAAARGGLRGIREDETGDLEHWGDIITEIDRQEIADINGLRDVLERHAVGEEVEVTYVRDGKQQRARVKLQEIELKGSP
jgi:S1-C subfamily serine protease